MATRINYIGSKWAGDAPDTLEQLYAVLQSEPLDPWFEEYGDFAINNPPDFPRASIRFWGNFYTVSYVFSVDTDDPDVIATMMALIRMNKGTRVYQDARAESRLREAIKQQTIADDSARRSRERARRMT